LNECNIGIERVSERDLLNLGFASNNYQILSLLRQKHLVLDVALELGKILKQRGHKVYYTRTKDEFINLRDRTKVANDKNADLFISLHANAAPNEAKKLSMKGLETFFLSH